MITFDWAQAGALFSWVVFIALILIIAAVALVIVLAIVRGFADWYREHKRTRL